MSHRIQRIIGKPDVVHPLDHRMIAQEFRYLAGVGHVALHAQGERLNSLQKQEPVKRRQRGAGVALTDSSASRHKSSVAEMIDIDDSVISNFWHVQHVELFRILSPRKLAAIYDHPADTGAAATDELCHGMNDNIGPVFDRAQQNRCSYRVVNHQRHAMLVRNLGQSFNVCHVSRRIANTLTVNRPRILVDQLIDVFRPIGCRKTRTDSPLRKDMREKRVSRAI